MSFTNSTYPSKIYRSFKEIEPNDFRTIIRFYEERRRTIERLEFEEYFELILAYSNAMFEIGAYTKYTRLATLILEESIDKNVQCFQGKDVFCQALFRKAAAHYHLLQYDKSAHLLKELIKIDPTHESAILLLKRTLRKSKTQLLKTIKAIAILAFLASTLVIAVEVLFINNLVPQYQPLFQKIHIGLLAGGIGVFLLGEGYLRWQAHYQVQQLIFQTKRKKALDA